MVQIHLRIIYVLTLLYCCLDLVAATKIAYKKPIYGKANFIKDKRYKSKADLPRISLPTVAAAAAAAAATTTTITTATEVNPATVDDDTLVATITSKMPDASSYEVTEYNATPTTPMQTTAASESAESLLPPDAEASVLEMPHNSITTTDVESDITTTTTTLTTSTSTSTTATTTATTATIVDVDKANKSDELTSSTVATTSAIETTSASNSPVPCTCGIFLSSQIQKGLNDQPLILNELDRMYPCNPIGRKQCQTKCLEAIVQHLPNSANIVCATLGHDCHKERAYLFIKNCQNQWWNTSLQAGREYCCKNGLPYRCPLLG